MSNNVEDGSPPRSTSHKVGIAISIVALGAAVLDVLSTRIEFNAITLGLLGIAAIPWLGQYLSSIELPGGIKAQFQDIRREVQEAKAEASTAHQIAEDAGTKAVTAELRASSAVSLSGPSSSSRSLHQAQDNYAEQLSTLIERYDSIRREQKPGQHRTTSMEAVAEQMTSLLRNASGFDVMFGLQSFGGRRLAAYSYLMGNPDPAYLQPLVDSLTAIDPNREGRYFANPYEQVWGLLALESMVKGVASAEISSDVRQKLVKFRDLQEAGSSRRYLVSRVLEIIDSQ